MTRTTILFAGLALAAACGGGSDADRTLTSDSALANDLNLAAQAPYTGVDSLSALEQGYDAVRRRARRRGRGSAGAAQHGHRAHDHDAPHLHGSQHQPDVGQHGVEQRLHERLVVRNVDGLHGIRAGHARSDREEHAA